MKVASIGSLNAVAVSSIAAPYLNSSYHGPIMVLSNFMSTICKQWTSMNISGTMDLSWSSAISCPFCSCKPRDECFQNLGHLRHSGKPDRFSRLEPTCLLSNRRRGRCEWCEWSTFTNSCEEFDEHPQLRESANWFWGHEDGDLN